MNKEKHDNLVEAYRLNLLSRLDWVIRGEYTEEAWQQDILTMIRRIKRLCGVI